MPNYDCYCSTCEKTFTAFSAMTQTNSIRCPECGRHVSRMTMSPMEVRQYA